MSLQRCLPERMSLSNIGFVFVLQGLIPILTLLYITLIADSAFSSFKSVLVELR